MSSVIKAEDVEDKFTNFVRRIVSVPHREIKAQLDAEKAAKKVAKVSASPVPAAASKHVHQQGS